MALSPDDLKDAYAKGAANWAKLSPSEREKLMDASRAKTYDPDMLKRLGEAKGGKITKVAGKPVGKDDGMIPAKRGEYVVKKSSTSKYGPVKMAAVNKGTAKVTASKPAARGKR